MSRFTEYLQVLMERHRLSQSDVAQRSSVPFAVINRTLNGHTQVSTKNYAPIVTAITTDPVEQAEALCCRLRDECVGPGADLVDILVRADALKDRPAPVAVETPLQIALRHLRDTAERDNDLRELLLDLARLTGAPVARKLHPRR